MQPSIPALQSFMTFSSAMPSKSCHSNFARYCHTGQLVYITYRVLSKHKSKEKITGENNITVMSALEENRRGNGERIKCMKERNDLIGIMIQQDANMLNIADEKHAMRKEVNLSKLLVMHMQSLHDAQQELKKLQALKDYDTDSSETQDAKCYVCVLSNCLNKLCIIYRIISAHNDGCCFFTTVITCLMK